MQSIMQEKRECYICGTPLSLELHHTIYFFHNRQMCDRYGLTTWLCKSHHIEVHQGDGTLRHYLEKEARKAFEENYPELDFKDVFGKYV